jgi:spore maturation protein CgeB
MKVFVLGKRGSIVHWTEDAIAGFRAAGHDVRLGLTRDPRLNLTIEQWLLARSLGAPRAALICRAIRRFAPDLILAVGAYRMPPVILEQIAALPGRPPLLGWVGDLFSAAEAHVAALFDAVAYTDSGLLALHDELHLPTRAAYLPHAANPRLGHGGLALGGADHPARVPRMVFVANPTRHRRAVVGQIRAPMTLYGPGWKSLSPTHHEINARPVGIPELAKIYHSYLAVLNIRNEDHVLAGLNQRHFDPYVAGTPVLTDDQPDLARCFDLGREVLMYRDADELNDLHVRLQREPGYAAATGDRGRRRVLAEHTYAHRLDTLAKLAGWQPSE